MPSDLVHFTTILRFWRSIEIFTLPDIPAKKRSDYTELLRPGIPLPWETGRLPDRPVHSPDPSTILPPPAHSPGLPPPMEGKQWRHTLYFHIVPKQTVIQLLAHLTGSKEFREPVGGDTCLSAITLDHSGRPHSRGYSPAAFIYGIKAIREQRNPEILADWLATAQKDYLSRFGLLDPATEPDPFTAAALQKEQDHLQQLSGNCLQATTSILCVSEQVPLISEPEAPFINSYYLHDLDTLIRHPHDIGRPLEQFLSPAPPFKERVDLLDPKVLHQHIRRAPPPGRWPSNPTHGLYTAQLAALQIALSDPHPRAGPVPLIGINGPPGTGKTTLLREIIVDIIVARARRLLDAGASGLFHTRRITIAERAGFYRPEASLFGNDGIVISGNSNAAVENISKELPLLRNIHQESFPEAEYFSAFATNILGEPCWGMLSDALGRSKKRSDFLSKFWFNKGTNRAPLLPSSPQSFARYLREQYEDHTTAHTNAENFTTTARRLRSLLRNYDLLKANLPAQEIAGLTPEAIHRLTPYSSAAFNTLRSEIFLCSLRLHEWAIRCNARYFYTNLNAFVDMLSGKWRDHIDGDIASALWNSFFFCIPAVSVTLASFQRQFHNMGAGSIGWLLLDEAGQATPPSVCGALWRSRRCIFIGDTQQIPPVVTIPEALGRMLQDHYGIRDDDWSPLRYSAQYLADRVTVTGTLIHQDLRNSVWTGIPLRAHRRCQEPMFSIANAIAYNGQMVQVTDPPTGNPGANPMPPISAGPDPIPPIPTGPDPMPPIPTGPSGWIDVRGFTSKDGHAVAEELQAAEDLLQQLSGFPGAIYIISPFRSIANICRDRYNSDNVECGTIHTFQGKEADIVILVLGTLAPSIAARNWVASGPNILNVAVTRAKYRLYVIGNRQLWSTHNYFNLLARQLPSKPHFTGRLF